MIRYAPVALHDVRRLHGWLVERDAARAAGKLMRRLADAERRIAERPNGWPLTQSGLARRYLMRLGRSTYVVHYVVDGDDQVIVRIWHGREDRSL